MSRKALHELGPKRRRARLNCLLQDNDGHNDERRGHILPPEFNHDENIQRLVGFQ